MTTEGHTPDQLRSRSYALTDPLEAIRLIAEHGSAEAALAELPAIARAAGVENYTPCPAEVVRHMALG